MKKYLTLFAAALSIAVSGVSAAAQTVLRTEMGVMAHRLVLAENATNIEDFQHHLQAFIAAAEQSKNAVPPHLKPNPTQVAGYQHAMQTVIDLADEAAKTAAAGQLAAAKKQLAQMPALRKTYHVQYKPK